MDSHPNSRLARRGARGVRLVLAAAALLLLSAITDARGQQIRPGNGAPNTGGSPLSGADAAAPADPSTPPPGAATPAPTTLPSLTGVAPLQAYDLSKRENFSAAMQIIVLLTVLSLAPAILIMMTSFTRIIIVLSLLRQALGTQQLPPNQILIGLSMFMTFLVMGPTWQKVNNDALRPYLDGKIDQGTALTLAQSPVREFMQKQIVNNNNEEDVFLFVKFSGGETPKRWEDVGTTTLVPAFMLSELKTAFLLGFKVYLPFLVIDMVISTVLISMGMMMLPPALISLPFKLLLFVLVDGWHLITGSLMSSFLT